MGRRSYKRFRVALPVTVSGRDTNGNPFKQTATTVEIGVRGLRIRGVYCLRGRGDTVMVEYKRRRANYRVAWMNELGGEAGLEVLGDDRLPFAEHLPNETDALPNSAADTYVIPEGSTADIQPAIVALQPTEGLSPDRQERRQGERRSHQRFHCAGTAKIRENGSEYAVSNRISEISRGGCYVETMSPNPLGTSLRVEMALNGCMIHVKAIVRYSQMASGMGLEFTKVPTAEAEKLDQVIAELSGEAPVELPEPAPAHEPTSEPMSDKEMAEAVQRWFGMHDSLSRSEFLKMIEEARARTGLIRP